MRTMIGRSAHVLLGNRGEAWRLPELAAVALAALLLAAASAVRATEGDAAVAAAEAAPETPAAGGDSSLLSRQGLGMSVGDKGHVRLGIEAKFHLRHSEDEELVLDRAGPGAHFPPDFFPADGVIALRPPDKGTSLEVSNVALAGEASFGPLVMARANIHFIDLYNRNPTSTADEVRVREAWLRLGRDLGSLKPFAGTTGYVQVGRAPRFTKQIIRRLESYGLWGTAVGRFEEDQLQAGVGFLDHFYVKGSVANGNPLFFRDVNALAGDNGTANRSRGNVDPEYQSGFPILYDAFPNDVNFDGELEFGVGAGARFLDGDAKNGIDVLGWYFTRELEDSAPIDGSFYGGDLDLLALTPDEVPELPGRVGLATSGNRKWEAGANVEGRWENLHVFLQYVYQSIAGLERHGFEFELAYRYRLGGVFTLADAPVLNWVQPDFRFSRIESCFDNASGFPSPSVSWDWFKYDLGVRVGVVRGVDLTVEYAFNETVRDLTPNELLVTLRVGI